MQQLGRVAQSVERLAAGWTVRGSNPGEGVRISAPVQTGPGPHPASCTMGTGSFPGVKSGRGVTLTPQPFQCRGHERVELYLYFHLRAVRHVQSLSACTRVTFTFTFYAGVFYMKYFEYGEYSK